MSYNNGFPVNYPQYYPQYQIPQMQSQMPGMTPPTIRADIVQVSGEQEARNYPVAVGASQMMIARDESAIFVKSAYANGQATFDAYDKRPPEPPEKPLDMGIYVTRDELNKRLSELRGGRGNGVSKQSSAKADDNAGSDAEIAE